MDARERWIVFSSWRRWISIGRLGKRMEEVHDRGTIEPRSQCDRAAILTPSLRNHLHNLKKAFIGGSRSRSTHDRGPIAVRSWPDRGVIVVRSWCDRGSFGSEIKAHSMANLEATTSPRGITLTMLQIRSHDRAQLPTIFG